MNDLIKTRFAPSPTGELHIGGARTALFNFLFARGTNSGKFVLRIDDTDLERSRREFESKLLEDLRWLGLNWDEGPALSLSTGPCLYRQSERGAIYREWLEKLREIGAVYPCFCTEKRLADVREEQLARGEPPRYDNHCRDIAPDEAQRRIAAGERHCWRLALPDGEIVFDDVIRGRQVFPAGTIGDFVLARSDGTPTYLFASVVDDFLMGITHVIRGDEHIPNTARQLAIIDRMNWPRPTFAHIPMVLSSDRQKLSKRTGSVPIREYRDRGYLPEALTAYLATLSWTPPKDMTLDQKFVLNSLAEFFAHDFESAVGRTTNATNKKNSHAQTNAEKQNPVKSSGKIVRSSPIHDEEHLLYWQKEAMKRRGGEWLTRELIARDSRFVPFESRLASLIVDVIDEAPFLGELANALAFLVTAPSLPLGVPGAASESWMPDLANAIASLGQDQNSDSWNAASIESTLRSFMKEHELKGREFFHPLRVLLTGQERGAPLPLIIYTLGSSETMARLSVL